MSRTGTRSASIWRRSGEEQGVVAVMVALLLVVFLGSAAVAIDLARLRHERHLLQAAVDLASLAGAGLMPVNQTNWAVADDTARDVADFNAPEVGRNNFLISFGCVVSDPEGDGGGDSADLTFACKPGTNGAWADPNDWVSNGGRAFHTPCNPQAGDTCNTITVRASHTVDFFFAPVLGFNSGNTGALNATACRGGCGQAGPLDVVFVIDRTRSMSDTDINNVKEALDDSGYPEDSASVLEFYKPSFHWLGLVALPYAGSVGDCNIDVNQNYPDQNLSDWMLAGENGLSRDYNTNGTLNQGSEIVQTINCLQAPQVPLNVTDNGIQSNRGHTDHGDPIDAAQAMLNANNASNPSRVGVQDVIVFFADGESNQPASMEPCQYAYNAAQRAKAAGTLVFTLGYGVGNKTCPSDDSAMFANMPGRFFLAQSASPDQNGNPSVADPTCVDPDGSGPAVAPENSDGDSYFCETRGSDLEATFLAIAVAAIQRTRLLNF